MDPSVVPPELVQHIVTLKRLYHHELMAISETKAYMEEKHKIKKYKKEIYIQSFAAMGVYRVPPRVENDIWSQHEPVLRYYYEEEDVPLPKLRQIMERDHKSPKLKEPFEYIQKLLSLGITKRNMNHHRRGHPYKREALAGRCAVLSRQSGVQENADTGEHVAVATLPARACTQPDIVSRFELLPEQPGLQALYTIDGQGFVGLGAVSNNDTALAACENIHSPSPPSAPFESGSPSNNQLYKLVSAIESMNDQSMEYVEHANGQNEGATLTVDPQSSRGADARLDTEWNAMKKRRMGSEEFTAWENTEIDYRKMAVDKERLMLGRGKKEAEIWKLEGENGLKTAREELEREKTELKRQREREETKLERQRTELDREHSFVKATWERMIETFEAWKLLIAGTRMQSPFSDRGTPVEGSILCADDLSAGRTNGLRRSARTRRSTRTGP